MKINKQLIIFIFILIIGAIAYSIIPSFEREEFNPELVEDISSGNITTTTLETTEMKIQVKNLQTGVVKRYLKMIFTIIC